MDGSDRENKESWPCSLFGHTTMLTWLRMVWAHVGCISLAPFGTLKVRSHPSLLPGQATSGEDAEAREMGNGVGRLGDCSVQSIMRNPPLFVWLGNIGNIERSLLLGQLSISCRLPATFPAGVSDLSRPHALAPRGNVVSCVP